MATDVQGATAHTLTGVFASAVTNAYHTSLHTNACIVPGIAGDKDFSPFQERPDKLSDIAFET
jgi:hypothetical protein